MMIGPTIQVWDGSGNPVAAGGDGCYSVPAPGGMTIEGTYTAGSKATACVIQGHMRNRGQVTNNFPAPGKWRAVWPHVDGPILVGQNQTIEVEEIPPLTGIVQWCLHGVASFRSPPNLALTSAAPGAGSTGIYILYPFSFALRGAPLYIPVAADPALMNLNARLFLMDAQGQLVGSTMYGQEVFQVPPMATFRFDIPFGGSAVVAIVRVRSNNHINEYKEITLDLKP
jgi:hypothetical protein